MQEKNVHAAFPQATWLYKPPRRCLRQHIHYGIEGILIIIKQFEEINHKLIDVLILTLVNKKRLERSIMKISFAVFVAKF